MRALARGELIILRHGARLVLVGCAGTVTTEQMAFVIRHSTGFVQVALHERDCDRLGLPEATPSSRAPSVCAYGQCVAVDASAGVTTGISGADRALTARVLADPRSSVDDLSRPGHLGSSPWRWCTTSSRDSSGVGQAVKAGVTSPVSSATLSAGLSVRERASTSSPR
ncbi:3,4-dihydroxy-2-butanone-4-phosphate synthase [Rhodococcus aetherivorans]|uniref:3,4-dihydroxy-2-butanone-4-phosphate synthase n=1 Tax=Rhodococcus aetherivorans TaxID=191292 RepID=UPI001E41A08C|nr:3,4-dihydroxy-2-butanone-4-phosphate synthase [Rhodococcus aetherivorans]